MGLVGFSSSGKRTCCSWDKRYARLVSRLMCDVSQCSLFLGSWKLFFGEQIEQWLACHWSAFLSRSEETYRLGTDLLSKHGLLELLLLLILLMLGHRGQDSVKRPFSVRARCFFSALKSKR